MSEFISPATRFIDLPARFMMKRGGTLNGARIAYESWGQPNATRNNVILILTGLSPNAHAAAHVDDPTPGWWEAMLGSGKPIDTERWHVICVNPLGSCKGSTGPASLDPKTGEPYRLTFPELSIEDIVRAARVADEDERAVGLAVLDATAAYLDLKRPLLYARVDLIRADDGKPQLLELDICEPSLSLSFAAGSAMRFAQLLAKLLKS